jgi:hypothetical protein
LAQNQQSFSLIVKALLLQAKFEMIEGNLQKASKYLSQAEITAKEKDLGLIVKKVTTEKKNLENEFEKWQELIQRNVSIQERLERIRMEDYLKEIQKVVKFTKD